MTTRKRRLGEPLSEGAGDVTALLAYIDAAQRACEDAARSLAWARDELDRVEQVRARARAIVRPVLTLKLAPRVGASSVDDEPPDDPRQLGLYDDAPCGRCDSGRRLGEALEQCPRCKRTLRRCNRHTDCDVADAMAADYGATRAVVHCHDDACEQCAREGD